METYFDSFHEDEQISENSFLPIVDEVIKDQLGVLESIKAEEKNVGREEEESSIRNQYGMGKEDFHQIIPDWQQHVGLLQSIDTEDLGLGLGLGLDCNSDSLNMYPSGSLFDERESSILSKALKSPMRKSSDNPDPSTKLLGQLNDCHWRIKGVSEPKKELVIGNIHSSAVHVENCKKLCELIKGENGLFGKVTVLNGEKEILEKNIVGLHCLNEIKESPHENCQVTSTVINGKRYKIIIKPKSLKVKKLSNDKIKKTLIKKLLQCNLATPKPQPKEDGIITEMTNGNYDVPILGSDVLPSWDLVNLDSEWNLGLGNIECESQLTEQPEPEEVKKIPPVRIKIPKPAGKKNKKKISESKSEEDVDVETVGHRSVEGKTLGSLLKNVESEVAKSQSASGNASFEVVRNSENSVKSPDSIKSNFPKQMIEKIEALKRKRDCRIPLIQAMPTKKALKCCTRMQDAVATMNRNKLLKILSGGDTISLDHDYCSSFNRKASAKQIKKSSYLAEKNPKKDSGMESGDVSDTSEGAITPETVNNFQSNNFSNRLLQDEQTLKVENERQHRAADAKNENSPFRNSEPVTVKANSNTASDSVKTETVSNGNKALTNNVTDSNPNSDKSSDSCISSVTVPSETIIKSESDVKCECKCDMSKVEDVASSDQTQPVQTERPKRKLKLEEYLSRRSVREKEKKTVTNNESQAASCSEVVDEEIKVEEGKIKIEPESNEVSVKCEKVDDEFKDKNKTQTSSVEKKGKKYWRERSRRSSSTSSGGKRESRRDRRSRSRSRWRRSGSSSSNGRKHEGRMKHRRSRRSASRERKLNFWSGSSSRSPSRESSTSSDYGSSKHSRSSSRYQRRSRSQSSSRGRSKSRNRDYSSRSRFSKYYNKSSTRRRSRSPYYPYSMREKQRQIEERRVIYVGRIEESMTNAKLRKRFSIFGPIIDISLHFREYGDNYGFVTYAYKADAYDAVEHGNDDPSLPRYDLCFGGRRGFCKEKYADLDGMPTSYSGFNDAPVYRGAKDSFDLLLKEAQAKLKNRKKH